MVRFCYCVLIYIETSILKEFQAIYLVTNILIITVKFIMQSIISINALIMVSGLYHFI